MKLQFSLSTLLVCVVAIATIAGMCVRLPVTQYEFGRDVPVRRVQRPPTTAEIEKRMINWGAPATVALLSMLWIVRRLAAQLTSRPLGE